MFLDASAIVAIIAREADGAALLARLGQATAVFASPLVVYESALGLARIGNMSIAHAQTLLDRFFGEIDAEVVPITAEHGRLAVAAFERFGKGRHAAALNLGDCFAYACAQQLDEPLLFKGDDFPQTDIAVA